MLFHEVVWDVAIAQTKWLTEMYQTKLDIMAKWTVEKFATYHAVLASYQVCHREAIMFAFHSQWLSYLIMLSQIWNFKAMMHWFIEKLAITSYSYGYTDKI